MNAGRASNIYKEGSMAEQPTQRTLFGFWASPFFSFVAQCLIESDLPFEYVRVSPFIGEVQSEAHRARNPLGKIPTLIEPDGTVVSESQAICRYLARTHAESRKLYPCDNAKLCAQIDALNDFFTFSVSGPFFNWLVVGGYFPNPLKLKCEAESAIFAKLSMLRIKDSLSRIMGSARLSPYLLGSEPHMPDYQLFQLLEAGKTFGEMLSMPDMDLTAFDERTNRYYQSVATRKSSQVIAARQREELPLTRREIFEQFPLIRSAEIRPRLSKLLGHAV